VYLAFAGYAAVPGTLGIDILNVSSATVNRVVGRVDALGTIDTSTRSDSGGMFCVTASGAASERTAMSAENSTHQLYVVRTRTAGSALATNRLRRHTLVTPAILSLE